MSVVEGNVAVNAAFLDEFLVLADVVGRHDGTTIGFFPNMGKLPQDRMEPMAEMSLTANRPLNWNLLDGIAEFHAAMHLDEAGRRAALSDPEVRRGLHHAIGRAATGAFAAVASFDRWRARAEIWRDRRVIVDSGPPIVRWDLPGGGERLYAESVGVTHVSVGDIDTITVRGATAGADTPS